MISKKVSVGWKLQDQKMFLLIEIKLRTHSWYVKRPRCLCIIVTCCNLFWSSHRLFECKLFRRQQNLHFIQIFKLTLAASSFMAVRWCSWPDPIGCVALPRQRLSCEHHHRPVNNFEWLVVSIVFLLRWRTVHPEIFIDRKIEWKKWVSIRVGDFYSILVQHAKCAQCEVVNNFDAR